MTPDMILVGKSKGKLINGIYLDSLIKAGYDTWVSCSTVHDGMVEIQYTDEGEKLSLEELEEIQADYKDAEIYLAFGKGEFHRDCIQPFAVLQRGSTETAVATCAVYLTGEFPTYSKEGSKLTDAFFALQEYIGPKLKKTARAFVCEPNYSPTDLTRLGEALNDVVDRKEFSRFVNDGTDSGLIILLANGQVFTHMGPQPVTQFDWGWTTNTLDYSEFSDTEKVEAKKPNGLLSKMKRGTLATDHGASLETPGAEGTPTKVGEELTKVSEEKKEQDSSPVVAKETTHETIVERFLNKSKVQVRLSDGFMRPIPNEGSRSHQKSVYNAICGVTPHGFRENWPFVKAVKRDAIALLSDPNVKRSLQDLGELKEKLETTTAVKDTTAHHIPVSVDTAPKTPQQAGAVATPATTEDKKVADTPPPPWEDIKLDKIALLEPKAIEQMTGYLNSGTVKKLIDSNSISIPTPTEAQAKERMLPPLFTKINMSFIDILKLPFEVISGMAQLDPKSVAVLWNDLRWEVLKNRLTEEEKLFFKINETKTEARKTGLLGIKKRA